MYPIPWVDNTPPDPGRDHNALASDLALWLNVPGTGRLQPAGYVTWENIEIPGLSCRPDILAIPASISPQKIRPAVFEVKVTRSDFRRDLAAGKWEVYRGVCGYLYFACPEGLILPRELPPGVGLVHRTPRGWKRFKTPRYNKDWIMTRQQWAALAIKRRGTTPFEIRDALAERGIQV